jgi:spermidine/putrescine transport system substrate-binding protein
MRYDVCNNVNISDQFTANIKEKNMRLNVSVHRMQHLKNPLFLKGKNMRLNVSVHRMRHLKSPLFLKEKNMHLNVSVHRMWHLKSPLFLIESILTRFSHSLIFILINMVLLFSPVYAADNVLNLYTWAEEIPDEIIAQFEKETGIKVNYSTYDSNEIMYTKLRTNNNIGYDIIEPSNYYIERMMHLDMLEKLDKNKLPNFKNIDPFFANQPYDPKSNYSIPFVWGTTGIFYNQDYFSKEDAMSWSDLQNKKFLNQLMMLDDSREVFTAALRMLGYSVNDNHPEHLHEAYLKLKALLPNIRLFNMDAVISILIDEDAFIGQTMSGDFYSAQSENPKLQFVYPKEGFLIWIDNFALLKNAPHKENAYRFLNFMMRPDIAKEASIDINYSTANAAAQKIMPDELKNNPVLYPSHDILKRGEVQRDIGEEAFAAIEKYWEQLKMSA